MTWGPHDLRLAEALAEQRLEAARRVRVDTKQRLWVRGAAPARSGELARVHLHWPAHLHRRARGATGHG
jgi:hypothetical protein